jgi:undecaprenyl diphosphate synthase
MNKYFDSCTSKLLYQQILQNYIKYNNHNKQNINIFKCIKEICLINDSSIIFRYINTLYKHNAYTIQRISEILNHTKYNINFYYHALYISNIIFIYYFITNIVNDKYESENHKNIILYSFFSFYIYHNCKSIDFTTILNLLYGNENRDKNSNKDEMNVIHKFIIIFKKQYPLNENIELYENIKIIINALIKENNTKIIIDDYRIYIANIIFYMFNLETEKTESKLNLHIHGIDILYFLHNINNTNYEFNIKLIYKNIKRIYNEFTTLQIKKKEVYINIMLIGINIYICNIAKIKEVDELINTNNEFSYNKKLFNVYKTLFETSIKNIIDINNSKSSKSRNEDVESRKKKEFNFNLKNLHMGFILDGNRRYAKKNNLSNHSGYRKGANNVKLLIDWILYINRIKKCGEEEKEKRKENQDKIISEISLYVFSIDNFKRGNDEKTIINNILITHFKELLPFFIINSIKLNIAGNIKQFPQKIQKIINYVIAETKNGKELIVNLAIGYHGQYEIINAFKSYINDGGNINSVDTNAISKYMDVTNNIDIIVRTGGNCRSSAFFPWQSIYSEWYFMEKYWPEFTYDDLIHTLDHYNSVVCNYGK